MPEKVFCFLHEAMNNECYSPGCSAYITDSFFLHVHVHIHVDISRYLHVYIHVDENVMKKDLLFFLQFLLYVLKNQNISISWLQVNVISL